MKVADRHYRTIWPDPENPHQICIIDQRQLPYNFVIEKVSSLDQMITAIREMHVRGAGLIGAAAGFAMYLAALTSPSSFDSHIAKSAALLATSRPTARNLMWAVERMLQAMSGANGIAAKRKIAFETACAIADEDAAYCQRIGQHGYKIIEEISKKKGGLPVNILTHCNAGWLAFVDHGSATAPIYSARDLGLALHVWVDETRPWNQGAKLTAWELQHEGINNTLICDNTGGYLMQRGLVDLVIVGADRVTRSGDVVNKIGTYLKALAANDCKVPFFVALPSSTFDWSLDNGMEIPIEQRSEEEITTLTGIDRQGTMRTIELTGKGTKAENYCFDVTPARLITGLITERGLIAAEQKAIQACFPEFATSLYRKGISSV